MFLKLVSESVGTKWSCRLCSETHLYMYRTDYKLHNGLCQSIQRFLFQNFRTWTTPTNCSGARACLISGMGRDGTGWDGDGSRKVRVPNFWDASVTGNSVARKNCRGGEIS